jgi:PAS domain S-box-containing protein
MASGNLEARGVLSEAGDELDGVMAGINMLGEELGLRFAERKRAEDEVRASEERLRILFEHAPDAIYLNDEKGNFVDGNKAAENLIGYKREEIIGKSFLNLGLLPPAQLPKAAANLSRIKFNQPSGPDEYTLIRKDGRRIEVEIATHPVRITGRTLALGIARDIAKRKRMEEERMQYAKGMEFLSESAMGFVSLASDEDIYLFIAQQLKKLFGRKAYIAVNSFDKKTRKMKVRVLLGLEKFTRAILKAFGREPVGMILNMSDEALEGLTRGKLERVADGLYGLTFGELPRHLAKSLEKLIGMTDAYAMGFCEGRELYSAAAILRCDNSELKSKEVIEIFMRQAATALRRRRAEEELKNSEKELKEKVRDLEDFHDLAVGRELKMARMEEEIEKLTEQSKNLKLR